MSITNRDKALRGEVVEIADNRLREMQEQAIKHEGIDPDRYHWHWAAVINELIARRAKDSPEGFQCLRCGGVYDGTGDINLCRSCRPPPVDNLHVAAGCEQFTANPEANAK